MAKEKQNGKDRGKREDIAAGANGERTANGIAELPDRDVLAVADDSKGRGIVINEDALSDGFVPATLLHRDAEMRRIAECVESDTPNHMWLYGKPGTGKTLVLRHVLEDRRGKVGDAYIEIDCWEVTTYHRVLDEIARQLDRASSKRTPLESKVRAFGRQEVEAYLDGFPLVVVLDQIDQPTPKEREAILYNLAQLSQVRIICVSSTEDPLMDLDVRVISRLSPFAERFLPYSRTALSAILRQRAQQSLRAGVCNDRVISQVAKLARGDARLALKIFREAAYLAQRHGDRSITPQHVEDAREAIWRNGPLQKLAKLSHHHHLLYRLTPVKGTIASDRLRTAYVEACGARHVRPIASRTYTKYLRTLINAKLLHEMSGPGKGNLRLLRRRFAA